MGTNSDPRRIDGNAIAELVLEKCQLRISQQGLAAHLVVVQVGSDPASTVYIKKKQQSVEKIGAKFTHTNLKEEETGTEELLAKVQELNADASVSGFIVQLPLPDHIDRGRIFEAIAWDKDVDCFNPRNVGLVSQANPEFLPATPHAVLHILSHCKVATKGKHCVVVGKSEIVGKPIAVLLANEFGLACTVSMVDKHTPQPLFKSLIASADILVVAAGVHHLIKDKSMLMQGCVVIDVGIHPVQVDGKRKLQGDVDYAAVKDSCSLITPVPGGVGPLTVAALMENLVHAATLQQRAGWGVKRKAGGIVNRRSVMDLVHGDAGTLLKDVESLREGASVEKQLLQAFQNHDTKGDGTISRQQFLAVLQLLDSSWTEERIDALVKPLIRNGDDLIRWKDLVSWLMAPQRSEL
eukprot:gnl/TRDRNA2_/TRDRNA2_191514_c0_seq1.p1 gnl/TRDRNA2_/TRDRNA2_191514_c0~~gnl/TRDRNA2_/TRDRNA2_191514_c0_seq1.p1  ORF type:complete len:409 (+),score=84.01 gnl/TRDRNA2_/TRDRNA2_191514_c0_seq1:63-1289(+)